MEDFESLWKSATRFRRASHDLKTLVYGVFVEATRETIDTNGLRDALDRLLTFLSNPAGRTDANCCVVDRFFAHCDGLWGRVPPSLASVAGDLSGTLHDTIYAPQIAAHFDSLPEQLLNRLRKTS